MSIGETARIVKLKFADKSEIEVEARVLYTIWALVHKDEFEAKTDFHDAQGESADHNMLNDANLAGMTRVGRDTRSPWAT